MCELFDKADTGGDGTISIPEYMAMCEEYGIELTEEHIQTVKAIANDDGEVRGGPGFYVNISKGFKMANISNLIYRKLPGSEK